MYKSHIYRQLIKVALPRERLRGVVSTFIAIDKRGRRMYEWFDKRNYRAAIRRAHQWTRLWDQRRFDVWCQGDVFL